MLGFRANVVAVRILRDIEDRIVVLRKGDIIHVSRERAAVLVREKIGELVGPERAIIQPRENRGRTQ